MNDLVTLLGIGSCATFVCLFLVKRKSVKKFLTFLLILLIIGIVISALSR